MRPPSLAPLRNRMALLAPALLLTVSATCADMRPDADVETETTSSALLADGSLYLTSSYPPSGVASFTTTAVDGAPLTGGHFVTASNFAPYGTLHLAVWRLDEGPKRIDKLSELDVAVAAIDKVKVVRVDSTRFVVAMHQQGDKLLVRSFKYDAAKEAVTAVGSDALADGTDVSLTALGNVPEELDGDGHVVVAYRKTNAALALTDYAVAPSGALTRNGTALAGAVPSVSVAFVPGSRPPKSALSQKQSLNLTESTAAACSNGVDDDADGFTDADDWDCCGVAGLDGQGACTRGLVVTATPNNVGNLKLISWRVSANGAITRLKDTGGLAATSYDLAPVSFQRVATFATTGAHPTLLTYDVDSATGAITARDTKAYSVGRNATNVRLVHGGGGRVFMPFSDSSGAGFLQTNETIDTPLAEERIQLADTFWSKAGAAFALGNDRVVLAQVDAGDKLVLRVYRDYNVPLVRGSYQPSVASTAAPLESAPPFNYSPSFSASGDASIAASKFFLVACGNGATTIYDKANPGNTMVSKFSHGSLFSSVLTEVTSPNEQNLNRHLTYQDNCDPSQPYSALNQCGTATFDTRCAYDETTERFVLISMIRFMINGDTTKTGKALPCSLHTDCPRSNRCDYAAATPVCKFQKESRQRYVAVAVSKTKDPRDGFNVYATLDNKFDDNPAIDASNGAFTIAHMYSPGTGPFPSETLWPAAFVMDIADLSVGATSVRATKVPRWQVGSSADSVRVGRVRGPFDYVMLYGTASGTYNVSLFHRVSRGPMGVIPFPVTTTGSSQLSPAALVVDDLGAGNSKLQFYFPEVRRRPEGGDTVQVTGVDFSISGNNWVGTTPRSIDVSDCGGATNTSCRMPAVAVNGSKVSVIHGRFANNVAPCPMGLACASQVCTPAGACVASPLYQTLRQSTFDRALATRTGTTTVRAGTAMYFNGSSPGWDESASTMQFPSAVPDPSSTTETFAIHDVYDVGGWSLVVAAMK